MAGDTAKIKRKIIAMKGHFTRRESQIMDLKCRASKQVVTKALSELNVKAEQILDLFS